jgi:hypothetical protein
MAEVFTATEREAKFLRERYETQLADIVTNLRRLADEVEREGRLRPVSVAEGREAGWSAASVVHSIQWGVANLPLGGLVNAAADIDVLTRPEVGGPGQTPEDGGSA